MIELRRCLSTRKHKSAFLGLVVALLAGCSSARAANPNSPSPAPRGGASAIKEIPLVQELQTALANPNMVASVSPSLGTMQPGDKVLIQAMDSAPLLSVQVDGIDLKIATDPGGARSVLIPGDLAGGPHQILIRQSSKFGIIGVPATMIVETSREFSESKSAPVTSNRSVKWSDLEFDTATPSNGGLPEAYDLVGDDADSVAIVSQTGKVVVTSGDGSLTLWQGHVPKGDRIVSFDAGKLSVADDSGTVSKLDASGAVTVTADVEDEVSKSLRKIPGAKVKKGKASGNVFRNPLDNFWYRLDAAAGTFKIVENLPRIHASSKIHGSIETQWPDGRVHELALATGSRIAVLDSACDFVSADCYGVVQANDQAYAVKSDKSGSLSLVANLKAPDGIRASGYISVSGNSVMAVMPYTNEVIITPLNGGK
jgi:hypothetical protein